MKNAFLLEMKSRGYLNQCTDLDKLDTICNSQSIAAYIGFDCTASSLHVGSLLQIMILQKNFSEMMVESILVKLEKMEMRQQALEIKI